MPITSIEAWSIARPDAHGRVAPVICDDRSPAELGDPAIRRLERGDARLSAASTRAFGRARPARADRVAPMGAVPDLRKVPLARPGLPRAVRPRSRSGAVARDALPFARAAGVEAGRGQAVRARGAARASRLPATAARMADLAIAA